MPFTTNPRNQWYDRNPVSRYASYNSALVAPHAPITRWSYTVPTNKKFYLQAGAVLVLRDAASGVPSYTYDCLRYTPSGGAALNLIEAIFINGSVNAYDNQSIQGSIIFLEGDSVFYETGDASTGGTNLFNGVMQGLEFDE